MSGEMALKRFLYRKWKRHWLLADYYSSTYSLWDHQQDEQDVTKKYLYLQIEFRDILSKDFSFFDAKLRYALFPSLRSTIYSEILVNKYLVTFPPRVNLWTRS